MPKRIACILLLWLTPAWAFAACDGADLIAAMPEAERAALQDRADAMPYAEGLLWQAVRGDTRLTLFGTYHFAHARTEDHLAALQPHIGAADAVYLETSHDDQARLKRDIATDPAIMFIMHGPTLPDLLGEPDWQRFSAEMTARAIPSFMAAKFKPIWAMMMLGMGPCDIRSGALDARGIDERIGEHAATIGTGSRSLEDYRTVLSLLDEIPQADQIDMIRLFLTSAIDPDDFAYTLRSRYFAQQTALIWEFSRALSIAEGPPDAARDFALFEDLLLTRRNRAWAQDLSRPDLTGRIFVAAGAGHLPGESGLLHMLAKRGFTITRLPFDP